MKIIKKYHSTLIKPIANLSLAILSLIIVFGSLEVYSRCKYWGGGLRQKGFYSRGQKHYTPKKNTQCRIVCLGGSTTHGAANVEDDGTYPFFLEQIVNEKFNTNYVEVLNSGLPGRTTEHLRDFLKERIDDYDQELDIIILHSLYNQFSHFLLCMNDPEKDVYIRPEHPYRYKRVYNWNKITSLEAINITLMEHSYFYTRLREKLLKIKKRNINEYYSEQRKKEGIGFIGKESEVFRIDTEENREKTLSIFIDRYRNAIEDIVLLSRSRNVDVVLIIPPYPTYHKKPEEDVATYRSRQYFDGVFRKARECIIEIGQKYGLLVVDAESKFLQIKRNSELFHDTLHLTEEGNYILADSIASELVPYLDRLKE